MPVSNSTESDELPHNSYSQSHLIHAPYLYLNKIPGKNFRAVFINKPNSIIKAPQADVDTIVEVISKLHTVSLLFDDVEDSAAMRRGQPSAHSIFGVPRTINSATLVLLETVNEFKLRMPQLESILLEELINLHRGQGMELHWRDSNICPSENEYLEMVRNKTAGLYRLAVRLLQACASEHSATTHDTEVVDLVPLADMFGIIYQIRDDWLNMLSSQYTDQKGMFEDLTEGKFSFLLVHAFAHNHESSNVLRSILLMRTTDVNIKKYAIEIIKNCGSVEYTENYLNDCYERTCSKIDALQLTNPQPLYEVLDAICDRKSL